MGTRQNASAQLVQREIDNKLSSAESKKLFKALKAKYWVSGLDDFGERLILSAHILHTDKNDRIAFIKKEMALRKRKNNLVKTT